MILWYIYGPVTTSQMAVKIPQNLTELRSVDILPRSRASMAASCEPSSWSDMTRASICSRIGVGRSARSGGKSSGISPLPSWVACLSRSGEFSSVNPGGAGAMVMLLPKSMRHSSSGVLGGGIRVKSAKNRWKIMKQILKMSLRFWQKHRSNFRYPSTEIWNCVLQHFEAKTKWPHLADNTFKCTLLNGDAWIYAEFDCSSFLKVELTIRHHCPGDGFAPYRHQADTLTHWGRVMHMCQWTNPIMACRLVGA